ncbi:Exonuclease SbcC [Rubrivivax sp. A210]|nr:Exonuclease SbcC [Rubrivivax sp. A210]
MGTAGAAGADAAHRHRPRDRPRRGARRQEMTPPRSAFGASPPGGRRQWPGRAGSTASAWWFTSHEGP